jgi:hypothetical protein
MSREYSPGSERGKHEAMHEMFARSDARFTQLFLAAKGFEEVDIEAAFVFYVDRHNGNFIELNETMEPSYASHVVRRDFIPYDYEYSDGHYRLNRRDFESCNWVLSIGIESFESVKASYDEAPSWLIEAAQSLTDRQMPPQNDEPHSILTDIANMHHILSQPLSVVRPNEIFVPKLT